MVKSKESCRTSQTRTPSPHPGRSATEPLQIDPPGSAIQTDTSRQVYQAPACISIFQSSDEESSVPVHELRCARSESLGCGSLPGATQPSLARRFRRGHKGSPCAFRARKGPDKPPPEGLAYSVLSSRAPDREGRRRGRAETERWGQIHRYVQND